MKCFVVTNWSERGKIHKEGEAGPVFQGMWRNVNGETYNSANVIKDTPKNRELWQGHVNAMKAWKAAEPNVFQVLNQIER